MELPAPDGVEHRYVTTREGVRIHVACAGPDEGQPIMLVHGFPQHWWAWHRLMGPLAADGYRVLAPDLRGGVERCAPRAVPQGRHGRGPRGGTRRTRRRAGEARRP